MTDKRQQVIKQAGLKSRRAMVWLRDHRMPADPVCYTLAYEYLHSDRPKLKQEIDSLNIDDADYLAKIHQIYQSCIIEEDYQKLAMSGDIGNKYVSEILSLLLSSQDSIEDYSGILDAVNLEIGGGKSSKATQSEPATEKATEPTTEKITTFESSGNKDDYLAIAEKADKDDLTSALDFNGLKQTLVTAIKHKDNFPISIFRVNIDRFKQFNDTNGKFMGDSVLKIMVKTLKDQLDKSALTSRFESDEFIVLLPETRVKDAVVIADTLRNKISTLILKKKNSTVAIKFTVSIGVAEMRAPELFESTLTKSRIALARSKALGRNCVNKED